MGFLSSKDIVVIIVTQRPQIKNDYKKRKNRPNIDITIYKMIQIGKSYQDRNGDWVTIDGHVKTNRTYFYSTEHAYYNERGEFILKKGWRTSPKNRLNLYV